MTSTVTGVSGPGDSNGKYKPQNNCSCSCCCGNEEQVTNNQSNNKSCTNKKIIICGRVIKNKFC